ncbi:hypothetical protein, partial [Rhodothermus marinus]|uniref:hypothetical protein n=1 Tax=Rhodothermus marinus TaxID=29549 RepID=UPI001FB49EE4
NVTCSCTVPPASSTHPAHRSPGTHLFPTRLVPMATSKRRMPLSRSRASRVSDSRVRSWLQGAEVARSSSGGVGSAFSPKVVGLGPGPATQSSGSL